MCMAMHATEGNTESPWHDSSASLNAFNQQERSQLESLKTQNERNPGNFGTLTQLASLLHQLDHAHPDGGSRIPEAEAAYRSATGLPGLRYKMKSDCRERAKNFCINRLVRCHAFLE